MPKEIDQKTRERCAATRNLRRFRMKSNTVAIASAALGHSWLRHCT